MTERTLWDRVDEPVLRWVASLPPSLEMDHHDLRGSAPFEPIPGLSSRDVHASLERLVSHQPHQLVDGSETVSMWSKLRVTAFGWIVLGEWPDLDRVATAASIQRLLRALAEEAPDEERTALVRAAGVVGRTVATSFAPLQRTSLARSAGKPSTYDDLGAPRSPHAPGASN